MRRIASLGLAASLAALLLLAGCGGANTEGSLQGMWFGPALDGSARRLDFDGSGHILAYSVDGNPTGLTGFIKHIDGSYYTIAFYQDETLVRNAAFMLSGTENHAAFYDSAGALAALQRGVDTWNPEGYTLDDVASVYGSGSTWFLDGDGTFLSREASEVDVLADVSFQGDDTGGRLFQSPAGTTLALVDGVTGIYAGDYEDQFRSSDADLTLLMTPDKLFVVGFANWTPYAFEDGWTATWVLQDVVEPTEP